MSDSTDVRWKQRFQNFSRSLRRLQDALRNGPEALSELEKEGAAQRFEYTYELGWKVMKDFLEYSGVQISPVGPRQVIKAAFAAGLLQEGTTWIEMLEHRNLLAHDYDEEEFAEVLTAVHIRYLPQLSILHDRLALEK